MNLLDPGRFFVSKLRKSRITSHRNAINSWPHKCAVYHKGPNALWTAEELGMTKRDLLDFITLQERFTAYSKTVVCCRFQIGRYNKKFQNDFWFTGESFLDELVPIPCSLGLVSDLCFLVTELRASILFLMLSSLFLSRPAASTWDSFDWFSKVLRSFESPSPTSGKMLRIVFYGWSGSSSYLFLRLRQRCGLLLIYKSGYNGGFLHLCIELGPRKTLTLFL